MIPMLRWELLRRRFMMIGWSIGLIAMVAMTVLSYGAVREQSAELNKALGEMSADMGAFVGTTDMFSPVGYMNSQLYFITLPLLFIILAVTLANSLLGKEENEGTLETTLARPISRTRLIAAKALSGMTIILAITGVTALVTILCAIGTDLGLPLPYLLLATFASGIFSAAFGAITFMLLAANAFTRKMAVLVALVFSLGSYLITSLSAMVDWLEWPSKLLPYHYYDTNAMLGGDLPLGFVLYTLGIFAVAAIVSVIGFRRRDIA